MDRVQAVRVLEAVQRFVDTGHGDVRRLMGYEREYRLRVGDWRVRFAQQVDGSLLILRVLHRSVAYR
ncbi:MAG: type II toxin-antitoxin system RelE/ParE family toxin [Acidobacteria bacterium]|nr:type II toxin-antitoxin system RelE/ParE family toxin [Acidobacteriota bacterium]